MAKFALPSDGEMMLLHILWQKKHATVKEVHEEVRKIKRTGYTTTLKLMQIMLTKKFVTRDTRTKHHIYRPAVTRSVIERHLLKNIVYHHFQNDPTLLIGSLLSHKMIQKETLHQLLDNIT